MIAGHRWSAATSSDWIALPSGFRSFLTGMIVFPFEIAERAAPRREPDDREQEVSGLGRIGQFTFRLGGALAFDEARIAVLPSFDLPLEEGAPRRRVGNRWEVCVQAGEEAPCAIRSRILDPRRR